MSPRKYNLSPEELQQQASVLAKSPLLLAVLRELEQELIGQWRTASELAERERLHAELKGIGGFEERLQAVIRAALQTRG